MVKRVFVIIITLFSILSLSARSQKFQFDMAMVEYFRNRDYSNLKKYFKSEIINEFEKMLYEGMVLGNRKQYEEAVKIFQNILLSEDIDVFIPQKIRVIAKYLVEVIKVNEGFQTYIEKLESDYFDSIIDGNHVKAYYTIKRLVELYPSNPDYRLRYAKVALDINHPHLSLQQASVAMDLKPEDKILILNCVYIIGRAYKESFFNEYTPYYKAFKEFPDEKISDYGLIYKEKIGLGLTPIKLLEKAIDNLMKIINDPNANEEIKRKAKNEIEILKRQKYQLDSEKDSIREIPMR